MAVRIQGVKVMTVGETADLFGVDRNTIWKWINLGFPVIRIANLVLVLEPKARAWYDKHTVNGRLRYGIGVIG